MRKTLPNRSAASSALAWSSNPLCRSPSEISIEPKLLWARTISTGDSASSAISSASSRSATPPRSPFITRVDPTMLSAKDRTSGRPRVSAISRASRPIATASGSAPTIRKRAKFASTNAFEREAGAPSTSRVARRWRARARSWPPRCASRPARSDSDSAALSSSPVLVKWASACSSSRLSSDSACQNSAFPDRKSRSARSSSLEAELERSAEELRGGRGKRSARKRGRRPPARRRVPVLRARHRTHRVASVSSSAAR